MFISAITAICVGGIAAGVWLIVVVLSVMNGFEQTWREEILGNRAHFTVHSSFGPFVDGDEILDLVRAVPGVEAASPYLDAEGMVRGEQGQITSVRLRGIDPASVGKVTDLENDLMGGGALGDLFAPREAEGEGGPSPPGIVIGNHLALSMGLAVGDPLLLISPFGGPPTPLGPGPRLKRFEVVGIFQSSFYQYDEVFTYTTLGAARDFRKAGEVIDGIEARTTDHYRSRIVGESVTDAIGYPYYTPRLERRLSGFLPGAQDRTRDDVPAADDDHGRRRLRHRGDPGHDDHGEVERHRDSESHGRGGRHDRANLCPRRDFDRAGRNDPRRRRGNRRDRAAFPGFRK